MNIKNYLLKKTAKKALIAALLSVCASVLAARDMVSDSLFSPKSFYSLTENASPVSFSFQTADGMFDLASPFNIAIFGAGIVMNALDLTLDNLLHLKQNRYSFDGTPFDKSNENKLDAFFMRPYSKPLDITGTVALIATAAIPAAALMPVTNQSDWLKILALYANTLLFANGIKEIGKLIVYRPRPYMYFDSYPQKEVTGGDWCNSWPSGHTTIAFTSAAFTTYMFAKYRPDSPLRFLVGGLSFTAAAGTGILRMASGNHFLTDVLTGAAIGTVCGFLVPWTATLSSKQKGASVQVTPAGVNALIRL